METITLIVGCIEDVSPAQTKGLLEVSLSDVNIAELIEELGPDNILSEIKEEDIVEYLKEKKEREELENAQNIHF